MYIAVDCWIGLNRVVTWKDTVLLIFLNHLAGFSEFRNIWSIERLNNYEAEKNVDLAKWHTVLKEQLDKILLLDEEIYAELIADEKSTEEDITAEIDRAARLKADVLQ